MVNNTDGSIVGYKYFNFNALDYSKKLRLCLRLIPEGIDGTIEVMLDRPWPSQVGKLIGQAELKADMPKTVTTLAISINDEAMKNYLAGKHALFFVFKSDIKEKSLCTLEDFYFTFDEN